MRTIHKQVLDVIGEQVIFLPIDAKILCLKNQRESVCMWYECDTDYPIERVVIRCYGTGQEIEGNLEYLGTVLTLNGNGVWHYFKLL